MSIKVELRREHFVRIGEHEILLAFNNDKDAEAFEEWWNDEGKDAYDKWDASYWGKP